MKESEFFIEKIKWLEDEIDGNGKTEHRENKSTKRTETNDKPKEIKIVPRSKTILSKVHTETIGKN